MINPRPTFFVDDAAVAARSAEVPSASFTTGMNFAASSTCGAGINIDGGAVAGTPAQFTLLDQRGGARTPQTSQLIGGSGLGEGTTGTLPDGSIRAGTPSVNGDGSITGAQENAGLNTLGTGWEAPVVP